MNLNPVPPGERPEDELSGQQAIDALRAAMCPDADGVVTVPRSYWAYILLDSVTVNTDGEIVIALLVRRWPEVKRLRLQFRRSQAGRLWVELGKALESTAP